NTSLGIMPGGAMNCCVLCVVLRPEYCTSASVTSLQICILISACALGGSFFTACAMLSKNNSILLPSDVKAKCFRGGRMSGLQSFRTYLSKIRQRTIQSKLVRDVFPDFLFEVLQLHWHTLHLGTIEHRVLFDRLYDVQRYLIGIRWYSHHGYRLCVNLQKETSYYNILMFVS
ncbi:hypothetical protein ALC57_09802, partial [Trachymyrmex cornetzi]